MLGLAALPYSPSSAHAFSQAWAQAKLPGVVVPSAPFSHARTTCSCWECFLPAEQSQYDLGRLSATSPKRIYRTNGPALVSSCTLSPLSPSGLPCRTPAPPPRRRRRQGARMAPTIVAASQSRCMHETAYHFVDSGSCSVRICSCSSVACVTAAYFPLVI